MTRNCPPTPPMMKDIEGNNSQDFDILDVLLHLYWQSKQREDLTIFKELPLIIVLIKSLRLLPQQQG